MHYTSNELTHVAAALAYVAQHGDLDELRRVVWAARRQAPSMDTGANGRWCDIGANAAAHEDDIGRELAALTGLPRDVCTVAARESLNGTPAAAAIAEILAFARRLRSQVERAQSRKSA
jgi:hypothetical protein